ATNELSYGERITRAAVAGVALWVVVTPVAAEVAATRARALWSLGEGGRAAYWFEVARRIEQKDWRYHWYAGQFWYVQAQASGKPAAAQLADESFRAGFAANPREIGNLLWLISTHVHLRAMLAAPADKATLENWGRRAFSLAPLDAGVKAQRELISKFEAKEQG
ncbi:MAG: hypothetical protein ABR570_10555, partial [Burkholderiales bacterium]